MGFPASMRTMVAPSADPSPKTLQAGGKKRGPLPVPQSGTPPPINGDPSLLTQSFRAASLGPLSPKRGPPVSTSRIAESDAPPIAGRDGVAPAPATGPLAAALPATTPPAPEAAAPTPPAGGAPVAPSVTAPVTAPVAAPPVAPPVAPTAVNWLVPLAVVIVGMFMSVLD